MCLDIPALGLSSFHTPPSSSPWLLLKPRRVHTKGVVFPGKKALRTHSAPWGIRLYWKVKEEGVVWFRVTMKGHISKDSGL